MEPIDRHPSGRFRTRTEPVRTRAEAAELYRAALDHATGPTPHPRPAGPHEPDQPTATARRTPPEAPPDADPTDL